MTLAIFGELTADRERIILLAEGADEEVGYASQSLQLLTPLIKPTDPPGALHLPASWPAVVQLSTTYGQAWKPGPALTAWITEQIEARTDQGDKLAVKPPPGLKPRTYQVAGARMIAQLGSALLFDEPRTGKTITTILGLVERAAAGHDVLPIVVVCPNAVVDPWVRHFQRWAPRWRVTAWRGSPVQRVRKQGIADVYVASYGTARMDAGDTDTRHNRNPLLGIEAQTIVADEVHALKGQTTGQSRAVRRLSAKAKQFIGLSGTPIAHHPGDLWPALYAMEPGAYPSRERWVSRYCTTVPGDYAARVIGLNQDREPEFRTTLLGQYRRVARADVLNELPKSYSIRTVEMPTAYRHAYEQMEKDMLAELPDGGELAVMGVLAQMTRLSQLASAAADVSVTHETVEVDGLLDDRVHTSVQLKMPSWKVDELMAILEERPGYAVAAFSPSAQLMRLAGQVAAEKGYKVGYVIGGQRAAERTDWVDKFQERELDLLCATTGAGGVGLTLSAADTLVFLNRPWSLIESLQAEDRAEGDETKKRGTEVIDIFTANTIETRVRTVLKGKAGQLSDLVKDPRIVAELLGGASIRELSKRSKEAVSA